MPDNLNRLADPRVSGRTLFALKRIAEALYEGWLTPEEANKAAQRISGRSAGVFGGHRNDPAKRAAQVVELIERILEARFPTRFRATAGSLRANNNNGDRA